MKSELRFYRIKIEQDNQGYELSLEDVYSIDDSGLASYKSCGSSRDGVIISSVQPIGIVPAEEYSKFNGSIRLGGLPTKEIKKDDCTELENIIDFCRKNSGIIVNAGDVLLVKVDL